MGCDGSGAGGGGAGGGSVVVGLGPEVPVVEAVGGAMVGEERRFPLVG